LLGFTVLLYDEAMSRPANSARPGDEALLGTEQPDALEPYAWEGDDDHVIFWMLSLTPTQRLAALQGFVDTFCGGLST
jgi:hypothetical protein